MYNGEWTNSAKKYSYCQNCIVCLDTLRLWLQEYKSNSKVSVSFSVPILGNKITVNTSDFLTGLMSYPSISTCGNNASSGCLSELVASQFYLYPLVLVSIWKAHRISVSFVSEEEKKTSQENNTSREAETSREPANQLKLSKLVKTSAVPAQQPGPSPLPHGHSLSDPQPPDIRAAQTPPDPQFPTSSQLSIANPDFSSLPEQQRSEFIDTQLNLIPPHHVNLASPPSLTPQTDLLGFSPKVPAAESLSRSELLFPIPRRHSLDHPPPRRTSRDNVFPSTNSAASFGLGESLSEGADLNSSSLYLLPQTSGVAGSLSQLNQLTHTTELKRGRGRPRKDGLNPIQRRPRSVWKFYYLFLSKLTLKLFHMVVYCLLYNL